jgi:hypothetical protein
MRYPAAASFTSNSSIRLLAVGTPIPTVRPLPLAGDAFLLRPQKGRNDTEPGGRLYKLLRRALARTGVTSLSSALGPAKQLIDPLGKICVLF